MTMHWHYGDSAAVQDDSAATAHELAQAFKNVRSMAL
jgi:hypothetical protein